MASVDQSGEVPNVTNSSDQLEDGKTGSLLSKVKDSAKGTFLKLKTKVKKGSDESSDDTSGSQSSVEAQRVSKEVAQSPGAAEVAEDGSEPKVSFEGDPEEDDALSPFARSGEDENAPLIASPTTYKEQQSNVKDFLPPSPVDPTSVSEQQNNVEDVMPPDVIEPTSVSELGEESSASLGHIPEAKDEEQQAVKEVQEGGPDADINEGFKDTFRQKDLQAIDGLPKPRGFDDDNESSVKSNDLRFQGSQDLGDVPPSQEGEGNAEAASHGGVREFSGDEKGNTTPHPPGSMAEFGDSMFRSSATHDLKPNEPTAAEAKHANEVGTFSRDFDPQGNNSSGKEGDQQHPPGSEADFQDSMFRSSATHGLKPNEPNAAEAKHAHEIGTFSRDFDPQANEAEPKSASAKSESGAAVDDLSRGDDFEGTTNFRDAPLELPPPALAGDNTDENPKSEGSSSRMNEVSYDQDNMPITAEQEAENYFDAISDDEILASEGSLDCDSSKDFNPDVTSEYNKQRDSLTESASSRIEAARNEEVAAKETGF